MEQAENEGNAGIEIAPNVWYGGTEQLAKEKIEARMRLLAMPPEEAQRIVETTLYPQHWTFSLDNYAWEETIPTSNSIDEAETDT